MSIRNHEAEAESLVSREDKIPSSGDSDNRESRAFGTKGGSELKGSSRFTPSPDIKRWEEFFAGQDGRQLSAAVERIGPFWKRAAIIFANAGVPPSLIAVGFVESGFIPTAISPKGAVGLWQFMPATALRYGLELKPFNDDREDMEKSTAAAARYLSDLHERFGDWLLALAAYNAGEDRVESAIEKGKSRDFWTLRRMGLLPQETQEYVPKVLGAAHVWKVNEATGDDAGEGETVTEGLTRPRTWIYATADASVN